MEAITEAIAQASHNPSLTTQLAERLVEFFGTTIPAELTIFLISLLPILELRGGLIAASLLDVNLVKAFIICFIGNILPTPFIILFIRKIFAFMRRFKIFHKLIDKLEGKSEKGREKIEKYKQWGLLLFVAIPLPGTGGWTGALIAALLDIRLKKAMPPIIVGILIAGIIISMIAYGIPYLTQVL